MDGRLSFTEHGRDKFVWNKFKQLKLARRVNHKDVIHNVNDPTAKLF